MKLYLTCEQVSLIMIISDGNGGNYSEKFSSLTFSSKNFIVLALMLRSLIYSNFYLYCESDFESCLSNGDRIRSLSYQTGDKGMVRGGRVTCYVLRSNEFSMARA